MAALIAGVFEPTRSLMFTLFYALTIALVFVALDWDMLRPGNRLAERLATSFGQLLICLFVLTGCAALVGSTISWLWGAIWFAMASSSLFALDIFNDRVTAWRPALPKILLAGSCPHVSEFADKLQPAPVQIPREQAMSWLGEEQNTYRPSQVVIFDVCIHAGQLQSMHHCCPVMAEGQTHPVSARTAAQKRLFDILCAAALLLCCAPVMSVIALLIRFQDGGPALFRQQRLGMNGACITILKFRSMRVAAGDDLMAPQAQNGDARITPLGKWMRHWGIDELAQLVNVLRGDMSMVGPRPHALAHDLRYAAHITEYSLRQKVRPGITGLAQIRGRRGETRADSDMALRVSDDLEYITRQSPLLDLHILFTTPLALLRGAPANRVDNQDRTTASFSHLAEIAAPDAGPHEGSHSVDSRVGSA